MHENITRAGADDIQEAIDGRVPEMNFLTYLPGEEINLIAGFLDFLNSADLCDGVFPDSDKGGSKNPTAGEALFRHSCTGCHTIGAGDRLGPDLMGLSESDEWLAAFIADPAAMIAAGAESIDDVGLVDYSQPGFPLVSTIAAERFLHDGGWDSTKRYFMVAANASDKMVIIDVKDRSFVTSFTTGIKPHPGRGANWLDPVYGWVNATPHIGEAKMSVYGADPIGHPENAWKVVRNITMPSAGSLFIKTHPNSPWVLLDMTLSSNIGISKQICAYSKVSGTIDRCFDVAANGKAVHFEFNQDGTEVWVSDWAPDGALVVLDAQTLEEITRITSIPTPTGKFNVHNTANDIY